MAADGLASFHRWALERPEGKKGAARGEREEEKRMVVVEHGAGGGVATRAQVATDAEVRSDVRGGSHSPTRPLDLCRICFFVHINAQ
jgi:hypothetical protein